MMVLMTMIRMTMVPTMVWMIRNVSSKLVQKKIGKERLL